MRPSLLQILKTDWPALFAAMGIPMIVAIGIAYPLVFPSAASMSEQLLFVTVPFSMVCIGVLVWRYRRILELFRKGNQIVGRITLIQLAKDRGRIEFFYQVDGFGRHCWQPVHQTRQVLALRVGQDVELLFHPEKPKVAVIKHLFQAQ